MRMGFWTYGVMKPPSNRKSSNYFAVKRKNGPGNCLNVYFYNYSYCVDSNTPLMCIHELALASVAQKIVFIMVAWMPFFVNILLTILLPFIVEKYPRDDRLMQDNDLQQL